VLSPKRLKYRKQHKGRRKGFATQCNYVAFGDFALQAAEDGALTGRQLEASRVAISRSMKRGGKVWVRSFPHKPVTQKPAEVRMGSGKGNPEFYVAVVKPGQVIFEINGVTVDQAKEAFRLAAHKLPIRTRFLVREQ
jgi:large subunit ribosomal protein L16